KVKGEQLEKTVGELEFMHTELDKERELVMQKDEGLEQLRVELEKWRNELSENREKLEEEVREKAVELTAEATAKARPSSAQTSEDTLLRKEMDLKNMAEQLKSHERDLESKERTMVVEMERLERERAEVQDLWNEIDASKKGMASVMDESLIKDLERRKQELDQAYLKLGEREEAIRRDEKRLDEEFSRLQALEEELTECARVLKTKEEDMKKIEGAAEGPTSE
ncbi:MAG: hypothetical protein MUC90_06705, partial [Thermoplasmata archaeon]|nr:hypothetical protein [Thermoplasmata archaeon]